MKKRHLLCCLLLYAAITTFTACKKEAREVIVSPKEFFTETEIVTVPEIDGAAGLSERRQDGTRNTFYGPAVQMGKGQIRTWINIRHRDGKPLALGIEMTDGSLLNLPTDAHDFAANTFILPLHQRARKLTPFDHITVNWEPEGHEPKGIYDVPHFDVHFYKISVAHQLAINGLPGPAPAPGFLPASYVIEGATVPQMGTHWLDPASPELSPKPAPFTHTFIYGSNNGHVHFLEPMITRELISSGTYVKKAFPQPEKFSPVNKNYPEVYRIWMNWYNNRHYVALTNFVWRSNVSTGSND